MNDSWANRLCQALKHVAPWPVRDNYVRIKPVDTDDDVEFYSDIRYLESLADAVLDDTRLARIEISDDIYTDYIARPLYEMASRPIGNEPQLDWPDPAAALLSLWRMDRDMAKLMGDAA